MHTYWHRYILMNLDVVKAHPLQHDANSDGLKKDSEGHICRGIDDYVKYEQHCSRLVNETLLPDFKFETGLEVCLISLRKFRLISGKGVYRSGVRRFYKLWRDVLILFLVWDHEADNNQADAFEKATSNFYYWSNEESMYQISIRYSIASRRTTELLQSNWTQIYLLHTQASGGRSITPLIGRALPRSVDP